MDEGAIFFRCVDETDVAFVSHARSTGNRGNSRPPYGPTHPYYPRARAPSAVVKPPCLNELDSGRLRSTNLEEEEEEEEERKRP